MFLVLPEKQQNKIIKQKLTRFMRQKVLRVKEVHFSNPGSCCLFSCLPVLKLFGNQFRLFSSMNMWLSYSPVLKAFLVILPMRLTYTQGSYASWKPLNFKSPFSRPLRPLKFSFVHFGPWKSLNFNRRTFDKKHRHYYCLVRYGRLFFDKQSQTNFL